MAPSPRRRVLPALSLVLASVPGAAQTVLKWPGEDLATVEARHLRAYVPRDHAERLRPVVARADQVFAQMSADAGFTQDGKLRVLIADWEDAHNGFSFVTPFPLVQVELAPALPESTIFNGYDDTERTLVHEFMHHISNDRSHGFRRGLERVFGRVLPVDVPGLLLWYLATPAHQTMPRFWHEGLGVWAETEYADPKGAWRGRGRDPLTHMVWRLDAAAGAVPEVSDWRVTWHEWPFGARVYQYGAAYTRYLTAAYGHEHTLWDFVDAQARSWAFVFDRGPRRLIGMRHRELMERARAALLEEQQRILATIRAQPVTAAQRLTPADTLLGAPAWRADGTLVVAAHPAQGRGRLHELRPDGSFVATGEPARALGGVRATRSGRLVHHEFNWRRIARARVGDATLGWRMLQPDAVELPDGGLRLAAVQLRGGGGQDLVVHEVRDGVPGPAAVIPAEGIPSSPVWRNADELLWVEVDRGGSRLVLAPRAAPERRRVLHGVAGRILHPVFAAGGAHVYFCADHTGVANAYRLEVPAGDAAAEVVPVTNTIGGVLACVPSPDGATLAILDHDHDGPFLGKISADPSTWPRAVAKVELLWPAPVEAVRGTGAGDAPARRTFGLPPADAAGGEELSITPYNGLRELRPLFWAPTTFAVPEGGYGVLGLASDPIFSHVLEAGVGAGLVESQLVGGLSYSYLAQPIELGVRGWRSELTFDEVVRDTGGTEYDYTETVAGGSARFGRGLFALERTFLLHAEVGVEEHDAVSRATRRYAGQVLTSVPAFEGSERFVEVTLGFDTSTFYPTSYAAEDGLSLVGVYRHSGFGGDLERSSAFGRLGYVWTIAPEAGHQVVLRGVAGWSDGDRSLQGTFGIGGGLGLGFPRGYISETAATGRHLIGGGLGYRFPVWRPFAGGGTTPFRSRQIALELFGDTAQVSDDELGGSPDWYTSAGLEVLLNVEFFDGILTPGIGVAWQLDGERDVEAYFTLGSTF